MEEWMEQKLLTQNSMECITVKFDGTRFGLVKELRNKPGMNVVTILSLKEAEELANWIKTKL